MVLIEVKCPNCGSIEVTKFGTSSSGKQRYYCNNKECITKSFQIDYIYNAYNSDIEEKIINMTANASGIRDISRVLNISTYKVMNTLKKKRNSSVK